MGSDDTTRDAAIDQLLIIIGQYSVMHKAGKFNFLFTTVSLFPLCQSSCFCFKRHEFRYIISPWGLTTPKSEAFKSYFSF